MEIDLGFPDPRDQFVDTRAARQRVRAPRSSCGIVAELDATGFPCCGLWTTGPHPGVSSLTSAGFWAHDLITVIDLDQRKYPSMGRGPPLSLVRWRPAHIRYSMLLGQHASRFRVESLVRWAGRKHQPVPVPYFVRVLRPGSRG